jgi:CCR4-NOT transcription complex subunit 1
MINNISTTNLGAKLKEFLEVLHEPYYPWFGQYMVMKRFYLKGLAKSVFDWW